MQDDFENRPVHNILKQFASILSMGVLRQISKKNGFHHLTEIIFTPS